MFFRSDNMKLFLFSTDLDILDEWKEKYNLFDAIQISSIDDLVSNKEIVIADYDSMATQVNKLIATNTLPKKFIVLEKLLKL